MNTLNSYKNMHFIQHVLTITKNYLYYWTSIYQFCIFNDEIKSLKHNFIIMTNDYDNYLN